MKTIYNRFLEICDKHPQQTAVVLQRTESNGPNLCYTFAEIRMMADSVAVYLQSAGIQRGDRCSIVAANGARWLASYLGTLAAGGIAVPLDTAFKPEQIATLLKDSGSRFVFTDAKHRDNVADAIATSPALALVKKIWMDGELADDNPHLDSIFAQPAKVFNAVQHEFADVAVLLYTSGTTSDPKGVMLTHGNFSAELDAISNFVKIGIGDAILGVLPLFHALAQVANLLLPLSSGCTVVYLEELNTTELLRALHERNITLFCCVPQFFYLIHEKVMKQVQEASSFRRMVFRLLMRIADMGRAVGINFGKLFFVKVHDALGKHMRYLITGGSRFDVHIGKDLETLGFNILQAYGLTECTGGSTVTPLNARFIGSVGRALLGVEVRILDAGMQIDERGPFGEAIGEVALRGTNVMKGYFNRPDADATVFKDGWFLTGDLGYLNATGDLFITGRKKEIIILSSGKNVYPEEIEAHYLKSPWIKEICVIGIAAPPGEPEGERLHAVIVPDLDMLRSKKVVNMKEVIRFDVENLSTSLAPTKRILSYEIWQQELPRTTTRKLKRFQIHKSVEQQGSASKECFGSAAARIFSTEDDQWLFGADVARAIRVIQAVSKKTERVHPADNLELDLGLDSMERVELVVALEKEFEAKADDDRVSDVYTVRELVEAVHAGIGAAGTGSQIGWDQIFAATETDDPEILAINEDRPIVSRLWFAFGCIVGPLTRWMFSMRISGMEKLPREGPYLLCPNHQSFIDAPVLVAQIPYHSQYEDLFYVGTSEIFGQGPARLLARSLKLIPVDPDAHLVRAMKAGSFGLKNGRILVLFPEGERSLDGTPKIFKKGAAILAYHHQVPIYPVAVDGFERVMPRAIGFKGFFPISIRIGDPIIPPKLGSLPPVEVYDRLTQELRERIGTMWNELRNRG